MKLPAAIERGADHDACALYMCPQRRSRLSLRDGALRARAPGVAYQLRNGIPHFLRFEPAEDEETTARLQQLNRIGAEKGWRQALVDVYGADSSLYRYVTDPGRASFLNLLPLSDQSVVLEVGPGLGQFTPAIAKRVKAVYALEVVSGQAEFAALRCQQEGVANVYMACGGDDCRLPYTDAGFDLVVLNLVLEWCAMRCVDEDPRQVQRRLLAEIYRVLKPGGLSYLTTKNRFALRYLIGKPDEHAYGMRFGSALPRLLLKLLLKVRGKAQPQGTLYSQSRLKHILRTIGFDRIRSFWAVPEMRYPCRYVPTDAASVREARRKSSLKQGEMRSTSLLMPLIPAGLVKYVTPGLLFMAEKPH